MSTTVPTMGLPAAVDDSLALRPTIWMRVLRFLKREPLGTFGLALVIIMAVTGALLFIAGTSLFGVWYHNWLPLIFAVPVLIFISAYPLLKRFSQLCHYYLGAALALAPVCAWTVSYTHLTLPTNREV